MTVSRIENNNIDLRIHQGTDTVENVRRNADACAAEQSSL